MDIRDETLGPPWNSKDPRIAEGPETVPKDTSAAVIVDEQLVQHSLKPRLDIFVCKVVEYLEPMMNGLLGHRLDHHVLLDGRFNYPKQSATKKKIRWETAYFIYSLLLEDRMSGRRRSHGCSRGLTIV